MVAYLVTATCWCERTEVSIPVQWVSEGRTGSCGPDCGPGCPSRASSANDSFDDLGSEVARTGKKTKMKRFNAASYDPRVDSSVGYANGGVRVAHSHAVILEVAGGDPTLCACGCGEPPRGKGATFGMGHDARLRGKLARALAAGCEVVLTDQVSHTVTEVLSPEDYASRFSTDKLDWAMSVKESASKARSHTDGEREILARALGPRVGDEKLIKVGRWDKTGKVVAVYDDGKRIRYEYADANGNARFAEQGEDGKIREVQSA